MSQNVKNVNFFRACGAMRDPLEGGGVGGNSLVFMKYMYFVFCIQQLNVLTDPFHYDEKAKKMVPNLNISDVFEHNGEHRQNMDIFISGIIKDWLHAAEVSFLFVWTNTNFHCCGYSIVYTYLLPHQLLRVTKTDI